MAVTAVPMLVATARQQTHQQMAATWVRSTRASSPAVLVATLGRSAATPGLEVPELQVPSLFVGRLRCAKTEFAEQLNVLLCIIIIIVKLIVLIYII